MKTPLSLTDPTLRRVLVNALILIVLAIIQPAIWDWVSVSAQALHDRRTAAGQLSNLKEQLAAVQSEQDTAEAVGEQLGAVLIDETEITQAVERLESKAQQLGVSLEVHNIAGEETNDPLDALVITATATGSVDALLTYLESIENVAELTTIQDFLLRPGQRPPSVVIFNDYSLHFNVAFATEAAPTAPGQANADQRFATVAAPTPPPTSFVSRLGNFLIFGSLILAVVLLVYRLWRKRKRDL